MRIFLISIRERSMHIKLIKVKENYDTYLLLSLIHNSKIISLVRQDGKLHNHEILRSSYMKVLLLWVVFLIPTHVK